MFKKLSALLLFITVSTSIFAQKPDDVLGIWLNSSSEAQLTIYKKSDKFYGKLSWLKEPNVNGKPKVDGKNPNASFRNKTLLGLDIVKDFVFRDNKWTDGKVYDPETGKLYSANITLEGLNQLNMRGYVGFALIGRTEVWKRVN